MGLPWWRRLAICRMGVIGARIVRGQKRRLLASLLAAIGLGSVGCNPGEDGGHESDATGGDGDPCAPDGDRPGVCPARGLYQAPVTVELRAPAGAAVYYTT